MNRDVIDLVKYPKDIGTFSRLFLEISLDPWKTITIMDPLKRSMFLCDRQVGKTLLSVIVSLNACLTNKEMIITLLSRDGETRSHHIELITGFVQKLGESCNIEKDSIIKIGQSKIICTTDSEDENISVSNLIVIDDHQGGGIGWLSKISPDTRVVCMATRHCEPEYFQDLWHYGGLAWNRFDIRNTTTRQHAIRQYRTQY